MIGLNANMQTAAMHRQQRDGAAWMLEWLCLPQLVMALARSLDVAGVLSHSLVPDANRMAAGVDDGLGLIYAEALSFMLAGQMPRPEAQAAVKKLARESQETNTSLPDLASRTWPDMDFRTVFNAQSQIGDAAQQARRFAAAVRAAQVA